MKKFWTGLVVMLLVLAPVLVLGSVEEPPALLKSVGDLCRFIKSIVTTVFSLIMIVAVIFILLAAWNYLTAGGSGEKVETATKQLTNAIIAIVIAVLAYSIPMVVASFLYRASPNSPGDSASIFSCPSS